MRVLVVCLVAAATVSVSSQGESGLQLVRDAAAAVGGAQRILALASIVMEGEGTQYNFGQDLTPEASGQTFHVTGYRRAIDLKALRTRTEFTRTPKFAFWLGPAPQRQVQGLDGVYAFNVGANGAARAGEGVVSDRRAELLRHPITALLAALTPSTRVSSPTRERGQSVVEVAPADGPAFTVSIDDKTKRPAAVATQASHGSLGDVRISTSFEDYGAVDGLQLPRRLTTSTDRFTTFEVRVTRYVLDANVADLAAPPAVTSAPLPAAPPPPAVTVTDVAPGIWQLGGSSHRSVLFEFADRLVLFEAPLNDARTLAVIARARQVRPSKPLTHVINTHHHFDHSGGVRAAVSEGLTIITHRGNEAFFREIVKRPRTLSPDALAKTPRPLSIETVDDSRTISDGTLTVVLYAVPGDHSTTMLMAYVPAERLLIEGDLYEASEHVHVFAAGLLQQIRKRSLDVERIVSLHSDMAPFARLVADAAAPIK